MKLVDNLDKHKILDEFEFRPDRNIEFRVTCTLVPKKTIFDFVRCIACLVLIGSLGTLHITWTGIKSQTSSNSGKITLFTLELLAFECQKQHSRLSGAYNLCNSYPIFMKLTRLKMSELILMSRKVKKKTGNWATLYYLLWSYMPLIVDTLGLR